MVYEDKHGFLLIMFVTTGVMQTESEVEGELNGFNMDYSFRICVT